MTSIKQIMCHKMFNGHQARYGYFSETIKKQIVFSIYLPPQMLQGYRVPTLYFLADSNSSDEDFVHKLGAQRFAAQWGIALVALNLNLTQQNNTISLCSNLPDEIQNQESHYYEIYYEVIKELSNLIENHFLVTSKKSMFGHGTGGFQALQLVLRNPESYASVSAFSPIININQHQWGKFGFPYYFGNYPLCPSNEEIKKIHHTSKPLILIDYGEHHDFDVNHVLSPQSFSATAYSQGLNVQLKQRIGYNNDTYFVTSFMDTHIDFHADALGL